MSNASTVVELLRSVETARRGKDYAKMDEDTNVLLAQLGNDQSAHAWKTRSKLSYELQMGAFQQVETLLEQTRMHAQRAIAEALKGGDLIGRLFAEMTLAGHILPASRKGREAMQMLRSTCAEAEGLLPDTSGDEERNRLLRVSMNCYWHQILLAIEYDGNPGDVERWKVLLESNPIFARIKDVAGARILTDAHAFIDSKK